MSPRIAELLLVVFAVIGQASVALRWLYRRMRNDEINRAFVRDMAHNHLPHLYHGLRRLCEKNDIELDEPPPIQFVDLNGKDKGY